MDLLSVCDLWCNLTLGSLLIFTLDDLSSRWTLLLNPVSICISWQVEPFTLKVILEECLLVALIFLSVFLVGWV